MCPIPGAVRANERRSHDYYLGYLALHEKQPDQAIAHFQAALRHLPPTSGMDLYEDCLANAYLELGAWMRLSRNTNAFCVSIRIIRWRNIV